MQLITNKKIVCNPTQAKSAMPAKAANLASPRASRAWPKVPLGQATTATTTATTKKAGKPDDVVAVAVAVDDEDQ